jgi:hypothetical protein
VSKQADVLPHPTVKVMEFDVEELKFEHIASFSDQAGVINVL